MAFGSKEEQKAMHDEIYNALVRADALKVVRTTFKFVFRNRAANMLHAFGACMTLHKYNENFFLCYHQPLWIERRVNRHNFIKTAIGNNCQIQ